jgi:hypothetical protein
LLEAHTDTNISLSLSLSLLTSQYSILYFSKIGTPCSEASMDFFMRLQRNGHIASFWHAPWLEVKSLVILHPLVSPPRKQPNPSQFDLSLPTTTLMARRWRWQWGLATSHRLDTLSTYLYRWHSKCYPMVQFYYILLKLGLSHLNFNSLVLVS